MMANKDQQGPTRGQRQPVTPTLAANASQWGQIMFKILLYMYICMYYM